VLASALILLLSWVFALVGLTYLVLGYRKIIFTQNRIGLEERTFQLFKFRTLRGEESQPLPERQFWLGKVLRSTSIDELPQLINVLKGDMSMIGPRPLPVAYLPLFNSNDRRRHQVRPGITGLAQVNGRTKISWNEKFRFDLEYVENVSLLLDIKIIFRTITLLFSFRKDDSMIEKPFIGSE
jgi:undecaprenyl phosphate N,N'-diacetylbacillosamine 1-phosphate transferase